MAIYYHLQGFPAIEGLQNLLEYHMLVFFMKLNFPFEFQTANQLGFEPASPGPKAAMLNIELHSIDTSLSLLLKMFFSMLEICNLPS